MKDLTVVVRQLKDETDLSRNYVSLPKNYGTPAYFQRADIRAVKDLVYETLTPWTGTAISLKN